MATFEGDITIWQIKDSALRDAYSGWKPSGDNIITAYLYAVYGLNAVNTSALFNAYMDYERGEETLYIVEASDDFIEIDGEEFSWDEALDRFGPDAEMFEEYFKVADKQTIKKFISDAELDIEGTDMSKNVADMLNEELYSLQDIFDALVELDVVN